MGAPSILQLSMAPIIVSVAGSRRKWRLTCKSGQSQDWCVGHGPSYAAHLPWYVHQLELQPGLTILVKTAAIQVSNESLQLDSTA